MIHGDRFEPLTYFLASVADRVTIDPQGAVALPGFALRRSYLKGTLEKIGVGFQEFRYFEYKSAMETFSRDSMSEADKLAVYIQIYEMALLPPRDHQPYVGRSAFAHKGGIHVSAILRHPETYEHTRPEKVGNSETRPENKQEHETSVPDN